MKKLTTGLLVLIWGIFVAASNAAAAELAETLVRPDRMAAGVSPLPLLITVKTGTNRIENGLAVRAGSAWSVSSDPVDITTETANLPAGITPWPGLGIQSVSGQTVNFSSSDLNPHLTYGFYITSGLGNNPAAGDGDNYKWLISTGDQMEVKVPVVVDDTVTITARVGANAGDFDVSIEADKTGLLSQDDIVTYTITYGSRMAQAVRPLVITGEWSRGTVEGAPLPSVDVADYVIGRGSSGFGGEKPVVDLLARKIIWRIPRFPANTSGQKVSFALQINRNYTGSANVVFDTAAELNGANVVTKSSSVGNTYKPPVIIPSPTPTSSPTATPTPSNGALPTNTPGPGPTASNAAAPTPTSTTSSTASLTPTPPPLRISKIDVGGISETQAVINVEVNQNAFIKIKYGETASGLTRSVTALTDASRQQIELGNLSADHDYYFLAEATDGTGNTVVSDIFKLRTASGAAAVKINPESITVAVENTVMYSAGQEKSETVSLVLTPDLTYSLRLTAPQPELVKKITLYIRNAKVLGAMTVYGAEPNSPAVDLTDIGSGIFVGQLSSPKQPGFYEIIARVEDINGNIAEQPLGIIKIINPLLVADNRGVPLENAKVTFYRFNNIKKIYELLLPQTLGIRNPAYTDHSGQINIALPSGKYRVDAALLGYESQTADFEIGLGEKERMPKIILNKAKLNLATAAQYYQEVFSDARDWSASYVTGMSTSNRFWKLSVLLTWLTFLGITWSAAAMLLSVWWWQMPQKLMSVYGQILFRIPAGTTTGTVVDRVTKKPVSGAKVILLDGIRNQVLKETATGTLGNFKMKLPKVKSYRLAVAAKGYETTPMRDFSVEGINAGNLQFEINNLISPGEKRRYRIERFGETLLSLYGIVWTAAVMVVEVMFTYQWGLNLTWPWLFMAVGSMVEISLIIAKRYEKRQY